MALLRAERLSKSFYLHGQPRLILHEATFSLEDGCFACVIGPSGCGKSTFLELLAGITVPDQGAIYYQDREITGRSGLLGYMPQDDLLFPWLCVVDNALLPVRAKGGDVAEGRKKIDELLPVFGLEQHATHLPYQLSGGLRQRVAFLRTCMTGSNVLLLDEPFASLDAITRTQLQQWLKDVSTTLKLSIILVTHDINEAICLGDKIWVMSRNPGSFTTCVEIGEMERKEESSRLQKARELMALVGV